MSIFVNQTFSIYCTCKVLYPKYWNRQMTANSKTEVHTVTTTFLIHFFTYVHFCTSSGFLYMWLSIYTSETVFLPFVFSSAFGDLASTGRTHFWNQDILINCNQTSMHSSILIRSFLYSNRFVKKNSNLSGRNWSCDWLHSIPHIISAHHRQSGTWTFL